MGVEAMVRLIERESADEAARLLDEAAARGRSIETAAAASAVAAVEAALERAEPGLRVEELRTVNAARLRLLERRAEIVAARVGAVFETSAARVAAIAGGSDPTRWARALEAIGRNALEHVGPGATVSVRASDAEALAAIGEPGAGPRIVADETLPAGLVVRSADGRLEVDALIPTRLERARTRLAEAVAELAIPSTEDES